jgi:holo-[acyl-carrier protein] synthase
MSKFGIGTDIEEISRFRNKEKTEDFLKKIYTEKELEYCFSKDRPAQHLAVRFAAKEAIIKAFGSINKKILFNQIEILNNEDRVPYVNIGTHLSENYKIKISLSHAKGYAMAVALIYKE